jgi:c-di-GMP-binding flagellar brake protein YcgR
MGITTPFPEPDSAQLRRSSLQSHLQVVGVLRTIADRRVLLNVFADPGPAFDVMTLRHVDVVNDELVFDGPEHAGMRHRMLESARLTCVGFIENAKLQFSASGVFPGTYEGRPAIKAPMPADLFRLERRASIRVPQDLRRGPACRLPVPGRPGEYVALAVLNLGAGGLAALAQPNGVDLALGAELDGCRLDLPGQGGVEVTLRIRHVGPRASNDGGRYCGFEFIGLSPAVHAAVSRFVRSNRNAS